MKPERKEKTDALAGYNVEKEIQKLRVRDWAEASTAARGRYPRWIELVFRSSLRISTFNISRSKHKTDHE